MAQVITGPQARPLRVVLYGPPGIGKTTFGADAPGAIFLPTEDGTEELDVPRFPLASCWDDALEAISLLSRGLPEWSKYGSLVVDTLDGLESLIHAAVCAEGQVKTLDAYEGGYGKGWNRALDYWKQFLQRLEALQQKRNMHVVLLAHGDWEKLTNPHGADYQRYAMKLHAKARALVREWARDVLFADWQVVVDAKKKKGSTSRKRLLFTQHSATFDVKTRGDLPPTLSLSFGEFFRARTRPAKERADDPNLLAAVNEALAALPDHLRVTDKGVPLVQLAQKQGAAALKKLLNWANVKRDELNDETPQDAPGPDPAPPATVPGAENLPTIDHDEDAGDPDPSAGASTTQRSTPTAGGGEKAAPDPSPGATSQPSAPEPTPPSVPSNASGATSGSPSGSTPSGPGSPAKKPARKVAVKS